MIKENYTLGTDMAPKSWSTKYQVIGLILFVPKAFITKHQNSTKKIKLSKLLHSHGYQLNEKDRKIGERPRGVVL